MKYEVGVISTAVAFYVEEIALNGKKSLEELPIQETEMTSMEKGLNDIMSNEIKAKVLSFSLSLYLSNGQCHGVSATMQHYAGLRLFTTIYIC